jgi:hypothetical protein
MNKKYFVTSDIHSFYDEFRSALKEAGYKKRNKDHILIICGDLLDRGPKSIQTIEFLKSIPKSRRILIRGNHELLFKELLEKKFPESHDFTNGTVKTFCQLADMDDRILRNSNYISDILLCKGELDYDEKLVYKNKLDYWKEVVKKVKELKLVEWFNSEDWFDYYELDNYIFVHSFIPLKIKEEYKGLLVHGFPLGHKCYEYDSDWRNSFDWYDAMWGCPYNKFKDGLFDEEIKKGKVLVCGHWHTSDFYAKVNNDYTKYDCPIYYSDNLIALDACTASTYRVNVLVIEK